MTERLQVLGPWWTDGHWWFDRSGLAGEPEWHLPVGRLQGRRPVGGVLVRTAGRLDFVPNRLEAALGGQAWHALDHHLGQFTLTRRLLRIEPHAAGGGAPERFVVNRRRTARAVLPL